MNILFFLTPKNDVVYVNDTDSVKDVLNMLSEKRYASIPILNSEGNYLGTIKEGDLLWYLNSKKSFDEDMLNNTNIMDIPRSTNNQMVKVDANVEDLFYMLTNQNFVPVIDDSNVFIGIVKRREVITYVYEKLKYEKLKYEKAEI